MPIPAPLYPGNTPVKTDRINHNTLYAGDSAPKSAKFDCNGVRKLLRRSANSSVVGADTQADVTAGSGT